MAGSTKQRWIRGGRGSWRGPLLVALLLLGLPLLSAPSAQAADLDAVGRNAQEVVERSCPDVAGGETSLAARQARSVVDAWAEVSEAYETSSKPWLLYWRGVLAICLGQVERGRIDLYDFLQRAEEDRDLAALVSQARRQLLRATPVVRSSGPPAAARPGIALGLVFAAAAGGAGGASAALSGPISDIQARLGAGNLDTAALDAAIAEGDQLYGGQIALLGAAIGLGAGAVVALVDAGVKSRATTKTQRALRPGGPTTFAFGVLPTDGGLVVALETTW